MAAFWDGLNLYSYPSGVGEGAPGTGAIRLGEPDFNERTLRIGAHGNMYHKIVEIESERHPGHRFCGKQARGGL